MVHTYAYDRVNSRTAMTDPTGNTTRSYSVRNQMLTEATPLPLGGGSRTVTSAFDAARRRNQMAAPAGSAGASTQSFTYTYDSADRQMLVVNGQSKSVSTAFDNMARKLLITQPNTAVASQVFDAVGNVLSITNIQPGGSSSVLTYTYDYSNQRTGEARSDGTVTTWTFDKSLQLTNEWRTNPSASVLGVQTFNNTYSYDPAGNRTLKAEADGTLTTSTYDNANRLQQSVAWSPTSPAATTTYSNDAVGHCTLVQAPTGYTYYHWDAAGNMTLAEPPAGVVTLSYDAERRRVGKTSIDGSFTRFVYDVDRLLQESAGDGSEEITYTAATDDPYGYLLNEYEAGSGTNLYYQYDAQASTEALSDDAGNVLGPYAYQAFGLIANASMSGWADLTPDLWASMGADDWGELPVGPQSNFAGNFAAFGQNGAYLDPETQLYLMGGGGGTGRYYDPVSGRFISEDRTGMAGGDANLFRYCGNDPVNRKDPSGADDARYNIWSHIYTADHQSLWDIFRDVRLSGNWSSGMAAGASINDEFREFAAQMAQVNRLVGIDVSGNQPITGRVYIPWQTAGGAEVIAAAAMAAVAALSPPQTPASPAAKEVSIDKVEEDALEQTRDEIAKRHKAWGLSVATNYFDELGMLVAESPEFRDEYNRRLPSVERWYTDHGFTINRANRQLAPVERAQGSIAAAAEARTAASSAHANIPKAPRRSAARNTSAVCSAVRRFG